MKLPKNEVIHRLACSLRLLGRDRNTVDSYCRTAAHFYDFVSRQPTGRTSEQLAESFLTMRVGHRSIETTALYRHPQLDRATSPLESLADQLPATFAPMAISA